MDDPNGDTSKGVRKGMTITVGVLALQGAFNEHTQLLRQAAQILNSSKAQNLNHISWTFLQVRTLSELQACDALIIPGGESTAISLVAQRSQLLEPLRDFVKVARKPTWGTCAGLILLAECANRTKKGGQDLIGGLDVRVNRNHFGRQLESFQADLDLPFLSPSPCPVSSAPFLSLLSHGSAPSSGPFAPQGSRMAGFNLPFRAIFIRAPIVERVLPVSNGGQIAEAGVDDVVVAPSRAVGEGVDEGLKDASVEVLGVLPGRRAVRQGDQVKEGRENEATGDIVAVRQGNVFGTSFHPELTGDPRIHVWWLEQVARAVERAAAR